MSSIEWRYFNDLGWP